MRRLLIALLSALLLTGCEDDSVTRVDGGAVALTVADYRYAPQNVSVRRGQVFIALRNEGRLATNLVLRRGKRERGRIDTLEPGGFGTLIVDLRPGTYTLGSSTGRHEVLGQHGTLTVR